VTGLAANARARGIAGLLGQRGERAAQLHRHQRHVAEEHEHASCRVSQRRQSAAQRSGHAFLPIGRLHDPAGQPGERRRNRAMLGAGCDDHGIEPGLGHPRRCPDDHRSARQRREQLAPAKAPPGPCRQHQRAPAGKAHARRSRGQALA